MLFLSLLGSFQPTPKPSTLPRTLGRLLCQRGWCYHYFLAMRRFSTGLPFSFSHLLHLRGSKINKYSSYHMFSRWAKSLSYLELLSKYCNRRWCWQGDHFISVNSWHWLAEEAGTELSAIQWLTELSAIQYQPCKWTACLAPALE